MKTADFDFDLPDSAIALRPAQPRDAARMLRGMPGQPLADLQVRDLPGELRAGDILVLNDTRVIPARLSGRRTRGESVVAVEATLHKRIAPDRWSAFMRPGKRLAPGDRVSFGEGEDRACLLGALDATVVEKGEGGEILLAFDLAGPALDEAIKARGAMPLPPYIAAKRPEDEQDQIDYQTIYAQADGSVAAPTAGLHFTPELMDRLAAAGVETCFVTLHVGAGTTSLRLVESAAGEDGMVRPFADDTAIFITPGYRFRAADGLMTNFHLPRSTLFMLVSAFSGLETMRAAYAHAIETGYRFYSYGDASLLWRAD